MYVQSNITWITRLSDSEMGISSSTFKCQSKEELRLRIREEMLVVAPEHRPKACTSFPEGKAKGHFSVFLTLFDIASEK